MSGSIVGIPVAVRWSDQDPNGHVNNATVVTLIEEARVQWRLEAVATGGLDPKFVALVANINLDYRHPVLFGPELRVAVSVASVGSRSYTLKYSARQSETLVFEATTVMVALGDDKRPRTLHDYEKEFLLGRVSID
jgi:acyl-CoA thioester hydrolase